MAERILIARSMNDIANIGTLSAQFGSLEGIKKAELSLQAPLDLFDQMYFDEESQLFIPKKK